MSRQIKDLQKLIEERAIKQLQSDLYTLQKLLTSQPLFDDYKGGIPELACIKTILTSSTKEFREGRPTQIFHIGPYDNFENDSSYMCQLYRYWLPIYIERESAEFLQRFDQIQQDVNYLLDNQPQ